ncbi:hypothetical protein Tco_0115679 [Tanacetum coccineum]
MFRDEGDLWLVSSVEGRGRWPCGSVVMGSAGGGFSGGGEVIIPGRHSRATCRPGRCQRNDRYVMPTLDVQTEFDMLSLYIRCSKADSQYVIVVH